MLNNRQKNNRQKKEPEKLVMDYACKLLKARDTSEKRLIERLLKKIKDRELVQNCINKLKKAGFVDDTRFARDFVRYRLGSNPRSFSALKYELTEFGVAENIIENVLDEISTEYSDADIARGLVSKKIEKVKHPPKPKDYSSLFRYLIGKGFSLEIAEEVLADIKSEITE